MEIRIHTSVLGTENVNTVNRLSFTELRNVHRKNYVGKKEKSGNLQLVSINSFYMSYNIFYLLPNGIQQAMEFSPAFKYVKETKYIIISLLQ